MHKSFATIDIGAPVETVWTLVGDPATHATFDPTSVRVTGPSADLGVRLKVYSTLTEDRALPVRITIYAPPRRMVWRAGSIFGLTSCLRSFALDPLDGNGTRFTLNEEWSGPLLRLLWRKPPDMTEAFASFCRGLKELSESMVTARTQRRR